MKRCFHFFVVPTIVCMSVIALGCAGGSGGPATVSVSGTVTLDGEPVEGAVVNFYSSEHDFLSTGVTSSDGTYELVQGAVPGENKVWISKKNPAAAAGQVGDPAETGIDPAEIAALGAGPDNDESNTDEVQSGDLIPPQYSSLQETVLTYSVPDGGTTSADFRLSGSQ